MRNEAMYQTIRQRQLKDKEVALDVFEVLLEEFESRVARDRRIYNELNFVKVKSLKMLVTF
jgi:hypothetical protein